MFEGMVKLLIMPPIDSNRLKELEENLRQTKGINLIFIGGFADGGIQIVVSAAKSTPLIDALMKMPPVEEAVGKDDTIHVSLK